MSRRKRNLRFDNLERRAMLDGDNSLIMTGLGESEVGWGGGGGGEWTAPLFVPPASASDYSPILTGLGESETGWSAGSGGNW